MKVLNSLTIIMLLFLAINPYLTTSDVKTEKNIENKINSSDFLTNNEDIKTSNNLNSNNNSNNSNNNHLSSFSSSDLNNKENNKNNLLIEPQTNLINLINNNEETPGLTTLYKATDSFDEKINTIKKEIMDHIKAKNKNISVINSITNKRKYREMLRTNTFMLINDLVSTYKYPILVSCMLGLVSIVLISLAIKSIKTENEHNSSKIEYNNVDYKKESNKNNNNNNLSIANNDTKAYTYNSNNNNFNDFFEGSVYNNNNNNNNSYYNYKEGYSLNMTMDVEDRNDYIDILENL